MQDTVTFANSSFKMSIAGVDRAALLDWVNASGIIGLGPRRAQGEMHNCDLFLDNLKIYGVI